MTFDSSRFTFDPGRDFLGVVMQQGRVQLDSDWNELVSQVLRRMQAGTLDTIGQAVVPRETPQGFQITLTDGGLKIGVGRMYVDGLLVENHGKRDGKKDWDVALAEFKGTEPVDYTAQPYYPEPLSLPLTAAASPYLVYLDVWQRDVTYLQYPELVEKAVGIDTTGRLQTVWQVKILQDIGAGATCESVGSTDAWTSLTRPSGARLFTSTGTVAGTPDPCQIPPSGGYKGLENQLYRVEIHDGGSMETATFKWSRDNATVASRISRINPELQSIVVESVGRDEVLRFSNGDWVEITDDVRELNGDTGVMCRIKLGDGVDIATSTIMLIEPLPEGIFSTDPDGQIVLRPNTRVRRWDQKGQILREDGTVYVDLDSPDREPEVPEGVIPVPDQDTTLFLENGILLHFNRASEGDFHAGDYWNFAARTADASIEILTDAPPRGIHHHYARLAVVTSTADTGSPIVSDCRVLWPPEVGAGHDCSCDRCVTPEGHNSGTATIQHAIDALKETGGIICLDAGVYWLTQPLTIRNMRSLRIRGKGTQTLLAARTTETTVIAIADSREILIESTTVAGAGVGGNESFGLIYAHNTVGLQLCRVSLISPPSPIPTQPTNVSLILPPLPIPTVGLALSGYALKTKVDQCTIVAELGLFGGGDRSFSLLTAMFCVTGCIFFCKRSGITFGRYCLHSGETVVTNNLVIGGARSGFEANGMGIAESSFLIEENTLHLRKGSGVGVLAATDGLRIINNEITGDNKLEGSGIVLENGLDPKGISSCTISGNRISNIPNGTGIEIRTALGSAAIKHNVIERLDGAIFFTSAGSAQHLSIENNSFREISGVISRGAIQVLAVQHVNVVDNVIDGFGVTSPDDVDRAAIRIIGDNINIRGNHLSNIGPIGPGVGFPHSKRIVCLELVASFKLATLSDNTFVRTTTSSRIEKGPWYGIRLLDPQEGVISYFGAVIFKTGRKGESFLMTERRLRTLEQPSASHVSIRSNKIIGRYSTAPLLEVAGVVSVSVVENYCKAEPPMGEGTINSPQDTQLALFTLRAPTLIVSQNYVAWVGGRLGAIRILAETYTVLGNICSTGGILIANVPLQAPWDKLNVTK